MRSYLLAAFSFGWTLTASADGVAPTTAGRPPSLVIHEPPNVSFAAAKLTFDVQEERFPVTAIFYTAPRDAKSKTKIEKVEISFGGHHVALEGAQLADIASPNLVRTTASVLEVKSRDATIVSLYLVDDSVECIRRKAPSCGVVEFDWTVGGKIEKIDQRLSQ